MLRVVMVASLAAGLGGCAGSGDALVSAPPPDDGVRRAPLTVEDAARILNARAPALSECYAFERLNQSLPAGADYVAQIFVPNDGTEPVVEMVAVAVPGHQTLEACLLRALAATRFPAHAGQPFTINVPIEAPR